MLSSLLYCTEYRRAQAIRVRRAQATRFRRAQATPRPQAFTLNWLAHHLDSAKVSAQPVSQDLLAVLSQVASYDSDSKLEFE